ncbi:hypothetical protein N7465_000420 [Penicillium sp. CMV-2018d]|nr:hypothetical protein N7465_000420 [Penicillium sp. CMV-2018d]
MYRRRHHLKDPWSKVSDLELQEWCLTLKWWIHERFSVHKRRHKRRRDNQRLSGRGRVGQRSASAAPTSAVPTYGRHHV